MAVQRYSQMKNRGDGKKFRVFPNNSKVTFTIKNIKEVKKPDYTWDKVAKKAVQGDSLVDYYRVVCVADLPEHPDFNNLWTYDVREAINDTGHGSPTKLEKLIGTMTGSYKMPEALYENTDLIKPLLMSFVGKQLKVLFSFDGKKNKPESISAVEEIQDLDTVLKGLEEDLKVDVDETSEADFDEYPDVDSPNLVADTFTYDVSKIAKDKQEQAIKLLKSKQFAQTSSNKNHWTGELEIKPLEKFKVVFDEAEVNFDSDEVPF